ncbi:MAG: O-antigen ligase family protein [Candidatus Moranbacteria bacterium]|nr:O-antigen ligase family protein [Candidatus Moranbacteria bacterium]
MNSEKDVEKIYLSLYLSAAAVGIIAIIYKLFGIVTYDNRLTAFYLSPNYLAMYLSSGLFFGFYFSIKSFLQKNFSKTFFLHSAPPVVILIPIFYTFSYGAWLSIIVALAIVLWMLKPFRKNILLGILLLLFCGFLLFFSQVNTQKFTSFSQFSSRSSFASRMMIWNSSALLIKENPIFGIGPGNFQNSYLAVQKYFPPYLEWAVPQPHNIFLAFWLQAGLLGFVGFLMLLFFIFKTLWQLLSNKKSAVLAAPLLGFFLYTILHGLIDTTYWKNDLAFLFWICLFIMLSIKEFSNEQK